MLRSFVIILALSIVTPASLVLGESDASTTSVDAHKPVLTGEVGYSDPNGRTRNHQLKALDELQGWSAKLQDRIQRGGEAGLPEVDQSAVSYMAVLYLYCTVKQGPCPFILETMLDSDIITTRAEKVVKCPLMTRFFKSYILHSIDERGKFLYSLTQGLEMARFNTESRPRFVQCKETVSAMLEDKDVLAQRFGEKGTSVASIASLVALLSDVKENKIDIYVATGVSAAK